MTDQPEAPADAIDAVAAAAEGLVPQLAERLRRHGLGEIEVTRGELRLRVSAAAGGSPAPQAQHGAQAVAPVTERAETVAGAPANPAGGQSAAPGAAAAAGARAVLDRLEVASPAVGFFIHADGLDTGLAVRKGDALGHVEMLGVRHDVRAPRGGTVTRVVAESGEAVEYGQAVVELDAGDEAP